MADATPISTRTQFCMVIGNPIAHSLSPAIHNAAYQALGLEFVYLASQVEDVESALAGMRSMNTFRGMSITIPHKIDAMRYVDEVREVDRAIGSINTVVHEAGRLIGMGTDGPGALKALTDAQVRIDGKHVLMLGAGGAARMIAFTLLRDKKPERLSILDINDALLQGLSADLRAGVQIPIHAAVLTESALTEAMSEADVIVHCTSVGMHPNVDASLVPAELFRTGQVVFDIVYTPLETRLLAEARARGLQTISGVEMFINQAVLQFEQFTGQEAPVEVMRRVVMEHLQR